MNMLFRSAKILVIIFIVILVSIFIFGFLILYRQISPRPTFENSYFLWTEQFDNIDNLSATANNIVRAEVVSVNSDSISFGDTDITTLHFLIYEIKILDIFYGSVQFGDTISVIQYTRSRHYGLGEISRFTFRREVNINYTPLEVNSDLILFLLPLPWPFYEISSDYDTTTTFLISKQSAYYYSPNHKCEINSILESVNESNSLVLTKCKLLNLKYWCDKL